MGVRARLVLTLAVAGLVFAALATSAGATTVKGHADVVLKLRLTLEGTQDSVGSEAYNTSFSYDTGGGCSYHNRGDDHAKQRFRAGGGKGGEGVVVNYVIEHDGRRS